jgi:hypothetical protein
MEDNDEVKIEVIPKDEAYHLTFDPRKDFIRLIDYHDTSKYPVAIAPRIVMLKDFKETVVKDKHLVAIEVPVFIPEAAFFKALAEMIEGCAEVTLVVSDDGLGVGAWAVKERSK